MSIYHEYQLVICCDILGMQQILMFWRFEDVSRNKFTLMTTTRVSLSLLLFLLIIYPTYLTKI